ncbi:MAG: hypothetical protein IT204_04320 [Fimbriimonadaceae bacterium]|nr:hypothetical protein [Fimbriimonadaceae bacterium]
MSSLRRLVGAVGVLVLTLGPAHAVLPPLVDHTFDDGERKVELKVPASWTVQAAGNGLQAWKDPATDLFGAAVLSFHEYDKAPTPDAFLDGALATLAKQYSNWKVIARVKPKDRPRVRLATVGFSLFGFPCRGYVMAVIGQETGTLGFCYAETVAARQQRLDELVQLLVAGSYGAYPVRGEADSEGAQAQQQAIEKLYGGASKDFQELWDELGKDKSLDADFLGQAGTDQPALRNLKNFLAQYLPSRPRERVKDLKVYCVPTTIFNAQALGRNESGPGFVVFYTGLTRPFRFLAQHYCHLRAKGLPPAQLSEPLVSYSERLAEAVLKQTALPPPGAVNLANDAELARYEKTFYSMIGLVMAHEMAHYYSRHGESGQDPSDPFSVQQREIDADAAAIANIQSVADGTTDVWEGGVIHAFGFLATVDNVAKKLSGEKRTEPEYTRSHPLGTTRLKLATAKLGVDDYQMRNDPWTQSKILETSDSGVVVVGGTGAKAGAAGTFKHPQSGVVFTFPEGWAGQYDPDSNVLTIRSQGGDNFPLALYSCGGEYSSPKAVTQEILGELKKSAQGFQITQDAPFDSGNANLKVHLTIANGKFPAGDLAAVVLGIRSPKLYHGVLLMTPPKRLQQDLAAFDKLITSMQFGN